MKKRLKEVCEFYSGTGFPIKYQGDSYGDLPFYKVSDIANNEIMGNCFLDVCNNYISYDTVREIKGTVIPRNVVVFAKIGEALKLNRRCITSSDCLIDNNVMGIGCNEKYLDIKYFYFFMKNLKIEKLAESTTVPSVRKTKLEELFIEVPNMELQLEIARTLEVIQDIILYRQKQLMQMDKLIKARFVEMFGDPVKNTKGWKVKRLGELSIQINSGNTPKGGSNVYVDEGIAFFRSQNVWKDRLEMEDIVYISNDTHASMKRSSLKNGDILMTKTGRINTENSSLGRAALYVGEDDKANVNGHVYFIRLKPEVNNKFILRILVSVEYRDLIRSVCVGGIDKRQLNKEHIENFPIICPPDSLIDKYIELVDHIDKSKVEVQKALDKAQLLFDSLMQKYFG